MPRKKKKVSSESEEFSGGEDSDYVPGAEESKGKESFSQASKELNDEESEEMEVNENEDESDKQEEEVKTTKRAGSKRYNNEDFYKMTSLVAQNPEAKHTGQVFWSLMMQAYGNTLLQGRNATALRNRWKKIAKMFPTMAAVEGYKSELAESLASDIVKSIDEIINNSNKPITVGRKREASHKPLKVPKKRKEDTKAVKAAPKPKRAPRQKRATKKFKAFPVQKTATANFVAPVASWHVPPKSPFGPLSFGPSPIFSTPKTSQGGLTFDNIVSKDQVELSTLERDRSLAIAANVSYGRDLVIVRKLADDTFEVKNIRELSEKELEAAEKLKPNREDLNNWEIYVNNLKAEAKRSLNLPGMPDKTIKSQKGKGISFGYKGFA